MLLHWHNRLIPRWLLQSRLSSRNSFCCDSVSIINNNNSIIININNNNNKLYDL